MERIPKYIAVLDVECATGYSKEIIELACVIFDTELMENVATFDEYVRPIVQRRLPRFCTELTGITQADVDGASIFPKVMWKFKHWISHFRNPATRCEFVTCGDNDLADYYPRNCLLYEGRTKFHFPKYNRWINLQTVFKSVYAKARCNLPSMIERTGVKMTGREHSGLDDAWNESKVMATIIQQIGVASFADPKNFITLAEIQDRRDRKKSKNSPSPTVVCNQAGPAVVGNQAGPAVVGNQAGPEVVRN